MILQVVIWCLVAASCLVVGKWLGSKWFGVKKDISGLKRAAQRLSIMFRERGLKRIPTMFDEFVIGDVDDLFQSMKDFAIMVGDGEEAIAKELDGAFERSLTTRLSSPEGRAALKVKLEAAQSIAVEIAKAAAPVVAAAAISTAVPAAAPIAIPGAIVASAL